MTRENKIFIGLVFAVLLFSVFFRYGVIINNYNVDFYMHQNEHILTTEDAYTWANRTKLIIENKLDFVEAAALPQLAYVIYKISPFKLDVIAFYLPIIVASLFVIPLMLIARTIGMVEVGVIASVLGGSNVIYYLRSQLGYFDTDMLNVFFPLLLIWSLIELNRSFKPYLMLIVALDIVAYRWWYPQSYSIDFMYIAVLALPLIYYYRKKEMAKVDFIVKTITLMMFGLVNLPIWLKIIIILAIYFLYKKIDMRIVYGLLLTSIILFLATGGLNPIILQINKYFAKTATVEAGNTFSFHFFNVYNTIREAKGNNLATVMMSLSANSFVFFLSFIGLIWLFIKKPIMVLSLPMIALGSLSLTIPGIVESSGMRFGIYLFPFLTLGFGYVIYNIASLLDKKIFRYGVLIIGLSIGLFFNYKYIYSFNLKSVLNKYEADALLKSQDKIKSDDYIVSWWDHGYYLQYFTGAKTIFDGGTQTNDNSYLVSQALLRPQNIGANLIEGYISSIEEHQNDINNKKTRLENLLLDNNFKSPNELFTYSYKPKKFDKGIYLYLSYDLTNKIPQIIKFSNIDILTGDTLNEYYVNFSNNPKQVQGKLILNGGAFIDTQKATLNMGTQVVKIKNFINVINQLNGDSQYKGKLFHEDGKLNVIYISHQKRLLLMNDAVFNSLYVQMLLLSKYDTTRFELISKTPEAKVYRLK